MFDRRAFGFVLLLAAAAMTGCEATIVTEPEDQAAQDACVQEGFDPGTTEFVNCVDEVSRSDMQ